MSPKPDEKPDGATLTLTVYSPTDTEPKEFTWYRKTTVGEAADEAAASFGYEGGTPSLQIEDGTVLDRDKPLVSALLKDGDVVEIVDVGGGV